MGKYEHFACAIPGRGGEGSEGGLEGAHSIPTLRLRMEMPELVNKVSKAEGKNLVC